jgi:hypothetical protein
MENKVELVRQTMDAALREHERRLEEGVKAFQRLSPQDQATHQLRAWERILRETV